MNFHQILIKTIDNKYPKFQLHNLLRQLRPRVRMCVCQYIDPDQWKGIFDVIVL